MACESKEPYNLERHVSFETDLKCSHSHDLIGVIKEILQNVVDRRFRSYQFLQKY